LAAYDKALYDAGITTSLKFKNGFAPKASGSSGGGSKAKGTSAASIAAAYSTGKSTKALGFDKTLNSLSSKAKLGMTVKTRSAGSVKALRAYKAPKVASSRVKLGTRSSMPKKVYA
jgi:hypothetical protein